MCENENFAQGHKAREYKSKELNSSSLTSDPALLIIIYIGSQYY